MSRPFSIRARILTALTSEPIGTLQLAERAGITARRRGEVVRLACEVLEDEGLIERVEGRRRPRWRRSTRPVAEMGVSYPPSSGWIAPGLDKRLANELIQGLVQSAVTRGVNPATRLREFRTLQQAAIAMSRDPTAAATAERLVRVVDRVLQELATVKS